MDSDYFNEHNPWTWAEKKAAQIREMVKVRVVIGTKDWLYERNAEFKAHLDELKFPLRTGRSKAWNTTRQVCTASLA